MAWDILSYLRVGFFRCLFSSQPTTLCTAINMTNIILFRDDSGSIQSIGFSSPFLMFDAVDLTCVTFSASLGFAITSISSQRLLIHARGVYLTMLTPALVTQRSWQRREKDRLQPLRRRFQRRTHLRPPFALGDKRRTKPRPTEN